MEMQPQGAPEAGPEEEGGSPDAMLKSAFETLLKLFSAMKQSQGVPPEALQKLGAIMKAIQMFGQEMSGGGQGPQPASGPGTMEAGANPNARPVL